MRRYSNKALKVSRDSIESVRVPKNYATLDELKSFQNVSGIPGICGVQNVSGICGRGSQGGIF